MRLCLFAVAALALSSAAVSQVFVQGYTTKNGTYVAPHYRSSPDSTTLNNWSTVGNVNPYTGQAGTRNPFGGSSYQPMTTTYNPFALTPPAPPPTTDSDSDPY